MKKYALIILVAISSVHFEVVATTRCIEDLAGSELVHPLLDWQKRILNFLYGYTEDYSTIEKDVDAFEAVDTSAPDAFSEYSDFAVEIQKVAQVLIHLRPSTTESYENLHKIFNRLRLLNRPPIRHLLGGDRLQELVARTTWIYNWPLRYRDIGSESLPQYILRQLGELQLSEIDDRPRLKLLPKRYDIKIEKKDLLASSAEAIIATLTIDRGFCNSCLSYEIRNEIGYDHKYTAIQDGDTEIIKGPSGRHFVLIVDYVQMPLAHLIKKALLASEAAGLKSVILPALRTGYHFGAVETSYAQVAYETIKGVTEFLEISNGGLNSIEFAIPYNHQFYLELQKVLYTVQPYNGTFREDIRASSFSGKGYEIIPSQTWPSVNTNASPIYRDMHLPWDLKHLMVPHPPVKVGEIENRTEFDQEVVSALNMPIKMPKTNVRVPVELIQFQEFLQKIFDHEIAINPDFENYYAYLTIDHSPIRKGRTQREEGVHIDGVQGTRYTVKLPPEHSYSAVNIFGTIFYDQAFDLRTLDVAKQNVHSALDKQARAESRMYTKDYEILFWNSYSVHEARVADYDAKRTFARVEFSKKKYDGYGDTVNPLFDYFWPRVVRPVPDNLEH